MYHFLGEQVHIIIFMCRVEGVNSTEALFSSQNFGFLGTVALSFLFDKYYLIMD